MIQLSLSVFLIHSTVGQPFGEWKVGCWLLANAILVLKLGAPLKSIPAPTGCSGSLGVPCLE